MPKNTSITLSDHFTGFIAEQIRSGRYGNVSEVIRCGLRLLEAHERKVKALQQAIDDGENSGPTTPLDIEEIIRSAQEKAVLDA